MAISVDIAEGLAELEGDVVLGGESFNWNGADYTCFSSHRTKSGKVETYGYGVIETLIITVRAALFSDSGPFPARGNTLTFQNIKYRIDGVGTAPGTSFLRLVCINDSRGT